MQLHAVYKKLICSTAGPGQRVFSATETSRGQRDYPDKVVLFLRKTVFKELYRVLVKFSYLLSSWVLRRRPDSVEVFARSNVQDPVESTARWFSIHSQRWRKGLGKRGLS